MTREESDDAKQARQEYDDNIRAESNDIIHTLQEKLSACEESLATVLADRDFANALVKVRDARILQLEEFKQDAKNELKMQAAEIFRIRAKE